MNLIPYSRYARTVLDCEKRPFLREFLDDPDTSSWHARGLHGLIGYNFSLAILNTKWPCSFWLTPPSRQTWPGCMLEILYWTLNILKSYHSKLCMPFLKSLLSVIAAIFCSPNCCKIKMKWKNKVEFCFSLSHFLFISNVKLGINGNYPSRVQCQLVCYK